MVIMLVTDTAQCSRHHHHRQQQLAAADATMTACVIVFLFLLSDRNLPYKKGINIISAR